MLQHGQVGRPSSNTMVTGVVDTAKSLANILISALVKRTVEGCAMCYPFNKAFAATTGHAGPRKHNEVKEQAIEALRQKGQGQKDVSFILDFCP